MAKAKKKKEAVVCATCGKEHTSIFSLETNQAHGCASDLIGKQGVIFSLSHYGSGFDTMRHAFKEQGNFKIGVICDECIEKARSEGVAIEDESYDYFAPLVHYSDN